MIKELYTESAEHFIDRMNFGPICYDLISMFAHACTGTKIRDLTALDYLNIELPYSFADAYDGQKVEMAFSRDELQMPSDVSHIWGAGEVIFVGGASGAAGAASTSSGDYFLADSSFRAYSRDGLEALSNHDLFIARNEIYARHGRRFQSAELQQRFGSKPWYNGTIAPSAFSESILSQVERDNANLMLAIEVRHLPRVNVSGTSCCKGCCHDTQPIVPGTFTLGKCLTFDPDITRLSKSY